MIIAGPIFIIAGLIQLNFPPKSINFYYGYRTKRSKKSQEAWDYAQRSSSIKMIIAGVAVTLTSFVTNLFPDTHPLAHSLMGIAYTLLFAVWMIWRVESELKERFG